MINMPNENICFGFYKLDFFGELFKNYNTILKKNITTSLIWE